MPHIAQTEERGIWAESALLYRKKLPLILTIVAGFVVLELIEEVSGKSIGSASGTVLWAVLAISVHASILNGSSSTFPSTQGIFGAFFWRYVVLAIPGFIAAMATVIMFDATGIAMIAAVLAYGLVTSIVLSIAGTWLPAVVAEGGDRSLGRAISRARETFRYVLLRLIVGCGVSLAAALCVTLLISTFVVFLGLDQSSAQGISPVTLIATAISMFAFAFTFVMLPVILSRAYLLSEKT
jgi:hypothetical protein